MKQGSSALDNSDSQEARGGTATPGSWRCRLTQASAATALFLIALTINLAGNARTGLWDRDEPRYATAVREMRARGDWIVPWFNDAPRYHKPVLVYWLMGLTTALAGDNPFGARLVSALAGAGTCVLTWWIGRRLIGPRGGLVAGLMLAVSPIVVAESKLATTDATLAFFLVAAQACLLTLAEGPSRRAAMVFWTCLGLAFLTKGPVGPALLAIAALLSWCWGWPVPPVVRRLHVRTGLLVFAAIAVPWYLAVMIATRGEFYRFAVGSQIIQRVTTGMEEHGGLPGYYLALSAVAFYPWSALVPAAAAGAWMRRRTRPELAFLLGWMIGPWIFLECLPTRLLHYYLPAYPACALLVAWMVETLAAEGASIRRWPLGRLAMVLLGGIGIAGTVTLAAAACWPGPQRIPLAVLSAVMGAGTFLGARLVRGGATHRGIVALAGTWGLFMGLLGGWLIPATESFRISARVGRRLEDLSRERGRPVVLLNYQEPGVIYAAGHPLATVRERNDLERLLDDRPEFLSAVTPEERAAYSDKYALEMTPIETVDGLSLTKGRTHAVEIVLLHRRGESPGREESTARRDRPEEPRVE
ncbi:ArnT family glycosyltransferase [Aquisphaera insulae]|uniref:ArnT family glycosyltransferase n=1 Tax=Aquisphaera insulae TaxID=2712864 RepID=UPI00202E2951|nr:glycosyltransferase family 39 protein [Aquisphaera insulae]